MCLDYIKTETNEYKSKTEDITAFKVVAVMNETMYAPYKGKRIFFGTNISNRTTTVLTGREELREIVEEGCHLFLDKISAEKLAASGCPRPVVFSGKQECQIREATIKPEDVIGVGYFITTIEEDIVNLPSIACLKYEIKQNQ